MGAKSPKEAFSDENRQMRVLDEGSDRHRAGCWAGGGGVLRVTGSLVCWGICSLCILLGQLGSGVHMSLYSWKAVFLLSL